MPVVIENPILNSPFDEPTRHFKFDDDGITDEIVESRRISAYFIPIPPPKKKGATGQLALTGDWTAERVKESEFINQVRAKVAAWRGSRYPNITRVTRDLLDYWTDPSRERRLFRA